MERKLSEIHIMEDDCVLELGARYGTVSVTINKKLLFRILKYIPYN